MDNFDKFNETKLPPINEFYSKLYDSNVNEKIMLTPRKFRLTLALKIWVNTMTCT